MGCATRSASRSGPARARSGSVTLAGTPGKRSTASRIHLGRSRTSAGLATRVPHGNPATTARTSTSARTSMRPVLGRSSPRTTPTTTRRRSSPERRAPPEARRPQAWPSIRAEATPARTTVRSSLRTTRASASGSCSPEETGFPSRPTRATVRPSPRRRRPWICRSAPVAISSTRTSTADRSVAFSTWASPRRLPGSSPPTPSTRAPARRSPTLPGTATGGRSGRPPGRRKAATGTRSPSTAPTPG